MRCAGAGRDWGSPRSASGSARASLRWSSKYDGKAREGWNVRVTQGSTKTEFENKTNDNIGQVTSGAPRARLSDLYFFLTTISWPILLLIIVALFAVTNCLFALGYLIDGGVANARSGSFTDAFFFSVQT